MSVSPDVAASLQAIQSQLGDAQLDTLLEPSADAPVPERTPGFLLKHSAGLQAGGAMLLKIGSYRFGRSSNSLMLGAGTTNDPQFGLTISPQGLVTVYPSPSGLTIDGRYVTEATPLQINQVIAIGSDRFMLCPSDRLGVTRTSGSADGSRPMPQKAKGKAVDQPIIDWVEGQRNHAIRARWDGLFGPFEVHNRITDNDLFPIGSQEQTFGHVLVGTADIPFQLPDELAEANRATREQAEAAFCTLPNAPISVDLTRSSLAIVGPRERVRAVTTWLAISLAVTHAPADLGITTRAPADPGFWSWLERFPHHVSADSLGTPGLPPAVVTISDERRAHAVLPQGVIGILSSRADVPDEFRVILELTDRSASFTDRETGQEIEDVAMIGMANAVALERSMMVAQHLNPASPGALS